MLVVELLLFSIQTLTSHLNSFLQVLLQMIAILSMMMIVLFTVLSRNKLRIPLEGTYS